MRSTALMAIKRTYDTDTLIAKAGVLISPALG